MARKKKSRKASHRKHKRSRKQIAAAKRNLRKAHAAHRHGKKRRKGHRRHHGHGGGIVARKVFQRTYAAVIARGDSPAYARKVAARMARSASHRISKGVEKQMRSEAGAQGLGSLFANLGAAGFAAHGTR